MIKDFLFRKIKSSCYGNSYKLRMLYKYTCAMIFIGILLFELTVFYRFYLHPNNFHLYHILPKHDNAVVIYSGLSFLDEVNAPIACALHEQGYEVIVYIRDGIQAEGITIPFTRNHEKRFYGHCVDQWVYIEEIPLKVVFHPKMMIFTSFPILKSGKEEDTQAFMLMNKLSHDTKVSFVIHRTIDILDYSHIYSPFTEKFHINFLYLAEHTYQEGKKLCSEHLYNPSKFSSSFIVPVMPLEKVFGSSSSIETFLRKPNSQSTFSVLGNFGGPQLMRKDHREVINCLKSFETKKSSQFKYLESNQNQDYSIDFIGHVNGKISYEQLTHGKVSFLKDLPPIEFYQAISNTKYLIAITNSNNYYKKQAASSVPAALMTLSPLVANSQFLELYPCLRDSKTLQKLNNNSECESIKNSFTLTTEEYLQAKKDMAICLNYFWNSLQSTLHQMIS